MTLDLAAIRARYEVAQRIQAAWKRAGLSLAGTEEALDDIPALLAEVEAGRALDAVVTSVLADWLNPHDAEDLFDQLLSASYAYDDVSRATDREASDGYKPEGERLNDA